MSLYCFALKGFKTYKQSDYLRRWGFGIELHTKNKVLCLLMTWSLGIWKKFYALKQSNLKTTLK